MQWQTEDKNSPRKQICIIETRHDLVMVHSSSLSYGSRRHFRDALPLSLERFLPQADFTISCAYSQDITCDRPADSPYHVWESAFLRWSGTRCCTQVRCGIEYPSIPRLSWCILCPYRDCSVLATRSEVCPRESNTRSKRYIPYPVAMAFKCLFQCPRFALLVVSPDLDEAVASPSRKLAHVVRLLRCTLCSIVVRGSEQRSGNDGRRPGYRIGADTVCCK